MSPVRSSTHLGGTVYLNVGDYKGIDFKSVDIGIALSVGQ
eukprot:CAMPEP_0184489618 /NCGR_PEP_ID=MMETSP0113_2-20130426/15958_1 /TAXON_ID=91329 /ORGANISM="Norrisiella sphaerica, Strain BC52" /LENGTH=39 /DNA_ID= /DNA_START= /DNA_END= /DNA_ORIENTATION=